MRNHNKRTCVTRGKVVCKLGRKLPVADRVSRLGELRTLKSSGELAGASITNRLKLQADAIRFVARA